MKLPPKPLILLFVVLFLTSSIITGFEPKDNTITNHSPDSLPAPESQYLSSDLPQEIALDQINLPAEDTRLDIDPNGTHPIVRMENSDFQSQISDMAMGDLNGDGIDDVVATTNSGPTLLMNGQNGRTFNSYERTDYNFQSVSLADMNGDGSEDIFLGSSVSSTDKSSMVLLNGKTQELQYELSFSNNIVTILPGDFGTTPYLDFAVVTDNGQIHFRDGSDGTAIVTVNQPVGTFYVEDFNGDGVDDIAIGDFNSRIIVVDGSDGSDPINFPTANAVFTIDAGDFNGDTIPDLVYAEYNKLVVYSTAGLTELFSTTIPLDSAITETGIADVVGDSTVDIGFGTENGTFYLVNGQTQTIVDSTSIIESAITEIGLGDFNDDGLNDFAVATSNSEIIVLNSSNLNFVRDYAIKSLIVQHLFVGNFNNDSIPDMVASGLLNPGVATFFYSDTTAPIVNYIDLPRVRTTDTELVFSLYYDEPAIETISMYFVEGGVTNVFHIPDPAPTRVDFQLFFEETTLDFWFELNDTESQVTQVGTSTDPYQLDLYSDRVWESAEFGSSGIVAIEPANLTGDETADLVAVSQNGAVHLVDGKDGSLIITNDDMRFANGEFEAVLVTDFSNDGIDDVVISGGRDAGLLLFIDGSNGQTLNQYQDPDNAVLTDLTAGEFTGDGITDIAALKTNETLIFDGTTQNFAGSTLSDLIGNGVELKTLDYDNNGQDDLALISEDSHLLVFDGVSDTVLLNLDLAQVDTNPVDRNRLHAVDITGDGIDDLVGSTTWMNEFPHVFAVEGGSGDLLFAHEQGSSVASLAFDDYNGDGNTDIFSLTQGSGNTVSPVVDILNFRGTRLQSLNITSDFVDEILIGGNLGTTDVNLDGFPDVIVQVNIGIYAVNSRTGKTIESISDEPQDLVSYFSPFDAAMLVMDLDMNSLVDTIYPRGNAIVVAQAVSTVKTIVPKIGVQQSIKQTATQTEIVLQLEDMFSNAITDASVSVVVANENRSQTSTLAATLIGDSTYRARLTPTSFEVGSWNILPIIDHPIYSNLRLFDYEYQDGKFISVKHFSIIGSVEPEYVMDSEGASFTKDTGTLSNAVEGESIFVVIDVKDTYGKPLDNSLVNITLEFAGTTYQPSYPGEPFVAEFLLDTSDLDFGQYNLTISYTGTYIEDTVVTDDLSVDLIPQQPNLDLDLLIILGIAVLSFLFFSFVLKEQHDIYSSLGTDPEEVYRSIHMAMIAMMVLFLLMLGVGFVSSLLTPIVSFVLLLASLLVALIMVLMWHFRTTVKQYYALEFRFRSLIQTLFLSLMIGLILAGMLIFGQQVKWIAYQMDLNKLDVPLVDLTIPQIVWEVAITGFLTGFLYILILDSYDTYADIKNLHAIEEKVIAGYYPKEPSKLYDSITEEAKRTFIGLSKGFLLWYGIILWSVINNLQLINTLGLPLLAFFIPVLIASALFFKEQILALLGVSAD